MTSRPGEIRSADELFSLIERKADDPDGPVVTTRRRLNYGGYTLYHWTLEDADRVRLEYMGETMILDRQELAGLGVTSAEGMYLD